MLEQTYRSVTTGYDMGEKIAQAPLQATSADRANPQVRDMA